VAGYLTEFSGLRWSLFQMAEYINMITASSVFATLFFGGWTLGALDGILGAPFIWYFIKVAFFLFVFIWLRATLPRIRYDQLMRFGWQVLLPLSVLNALVTAAVIAFDLPWWVSGAVGLGILLIAALVTYARLRADRRRVKASASVTVAVDLPPSVRLVRVEPAQSAMTSTADGTATPVTAEDTIGAPKS
jgi:NADH-quinone oxidoreductase subunit H